MEKQLSNLCIGDMFVQKFSTKYHRLYIVASFENNNVLVRELSAKNVETGKWESPLFSPQTYFNLPKDMWVWAAELEVKY